MNQIIYIFILFNLLFLIERKAINKLLTFVGIIITTALLLAEEMKIIEGTYFSYILILIEVSALTILFGFIIMLFPRISTRISSTLAISPLYWPGILILIGFLSISFYLSFIYNINWEDLIHYSPNYKYYEGDVYELEDNNFIRKIGLLFFTENCSIFKLIILTLILLFAIVALFFFF